MKTMTVAEAIWEGGEGTDVKPPVKWDRLVPDEKEYWARIADVAISTIRKIVCQPEYDRWSRCEDEGAVFALGAVGNIVGHLVVGNPPQTGA